MGWCLLVLFGHHVRPAERQMGSRIQGVETNCHATQFKGFLLALWAAIDPGLGDVNQIVDLRQATVSRGEIWRIANRIAEQLLSTLPLVRTEPGDDSLTTKPTVISIKRDVRLIGQAIEPFLRDMDVQRRGDATHDILLRLEPSLQGELERAGPDKDGAFAFLQ